MPVNAKTKQAVRLGCINCCTHKSQGHVQGSAVVTEVRIEVDQATEGYNTHQPACELGLGVSQVWLRHQIHWCMKEPE